MESITLNPPKASVDLYASLLTLTGVHKTMDMSVANVSRRHVYLLGKQLENLIGRGISTMECCGKVVLDEVTPQSVKVSYQLREYQIPLDQKIVSESYLIDNPYLSSEEVWVEVEYETVNMFNLFCSFFAQIVEKDDKYIDAYRRFLPEKELSLNLVKELIDRGEVSYFPIYAILSSASNWSTLIITDYSRFKTLFKEFLSRGFHQLDRESRWLDYLKMIFLRNDYQEILSAVPDLRESLDSLARSGSKLALDLLFGEFVAKKLGPRQNPQSEELFIDARMIDKRDPDNVISYCDYITVEKLKSGECIEIGDSGIITILHTGEDYVSFSWNGQEYKMKENLLIHQFDEEPNHTSMEYALGYTPKRYLEFDFRKVNLWRTVLRLMHNVGFSRAYGGSSDKESYKDREMKQKAIGVLSLVQVLIDRGDTELKKLYNELSTKYDWLEIHDNIDSLI